MKLGIVVVYIFEEATAPLMDLHLRHIERHTRVPYIIYASVNRLDNRFRDALACHPWVRICDCPDTPLRGMEEHAHYLDHLVRLAVEEGVSHIVTLHLDSFPIRSGWAEELAGKLSSSCAFATIDRINTACLFFDLEFYLRYQPSFLLSSAETKSAGYRKYIDEFDPVQHSGIGYGFTAYRNGKSWYYLKDTTGIDYPVAGRVYDDTIFHLGGAVHIGERYSDASGGFQSPGWGRFMKMFVAAARVVTPRPLRTFLIRRFRSFIERFVDRPQYILHAQNIQRFKEDPEKYLRLLRKDRQ
jgi:hypothetical protein